MSNILKLFLPPRLVIIFALHAVCCSTSGSAAYPYILGYLLFICSQFCIGLLELQWCVFEIVALATTYVFVYVQTERIGHVIKFSQHLSKQNLCAGSGTYSGTLLSEHGFVRLQQKLINLNYYICTKYKVTLEYEQRRSQFCTK